jgi:hypothetical protein
MAKRPEDLAAVEHDINDFFNDFVRAFCTFDGTQIAARYYSPCVALRANGSIDVMPSRQVIETVFEAAVEGYHREGCRGIRFKDLDVVPMGERAVLGTVTWELLREDGTVLRQWRQSYNLVHVDTRWMVFASTHHIVE